MQLHTRTELGTSLIYQVIVLTRWTNKETDGRTVGISNFPFFGSWRMIKSYKYGHEKFLSLTTQECFWFDKAIRPWLFESQFRVWVSVCLSEQLCCEIPLLSPLPRNRLGSPWQPVTQKMLSPSYMIQQICLPLCYSNMAATNNLVWNTINYLNESLWGKPLGNLKPERAKRKTF